MEKIPTMLERGPDFKVVDKLKPECAWVLDGEGRPTEKLDGTNVRLTIRSGHLVRLEKRRNPTKAQKQMGITDGWYVDADEYGPEDRWIWDAARNTDVSTWEDGEHSCEAVGPNIQGNPLGLDRNVCVAFNREIPEFAGVGRTYGELQAFLRVAESLFSPGHLAEGIVFHHPDGRRAKIKRKDFPAAVLAGEGV